MELESRDGRRHTKEVKTPTLLFKQLISGSRGHIKKLSPLTRALCVGAPRTPDTLGSFLQADGRRFHPSAFPPLVESSTSQESRCHTRIRMPRKGFIYRVAVCRNVGREEVEERERAGVHRAELIPGPRGLWREERAEEPQEKMESSVGGPRGVASQGQQNTPP